MKQIPLYILALCGATNLMADVTVEPEIIPDFYVLRMSDNGQYLISETGGEIMAVFNRADDSYNEYNESSRGLGNSISDNGTIVGSRINDKPFIITNEKQWTPDNLSGYDLCNFHGITPDATRICGLVSNTASTGSDDENNMMYLPMYVDVSASGEVSNPVILPCPKKDFVNLVPQYCTAMWISDDGRTILGQVMDNSGMMPYPIVYTQNDNGEWSYSLPADDLMNPNHITLPTFPIEPEQPEVEDYMSAEKAEQYRKDMKTWEENGYNHELYPEYENYMTEEQLKEYKSALRTYESLATKYNKELEKYFDIRNEIFNSSTTFAQNAMTLNEAGTQIAVSTFSIIAGEFEPEKRHSLMLIDLTNGERRSIYNDKLDISPRKLLANGCLTASTTASGDLVSRGFVLEPGADKFTPIEDYLGKINPAYQTWMKENLTFNAPVVDDDNDLMGQEIIVSGNLAVSDDFSVVAGGVMAYVFEDRNDMYFTYVFSNVASGITEIENDILPKVNAQGNGALLITGELTDLSIIDYSGHTLRHYPLASGTLQTSLPNGLYIVRYNNNGKYNSVKISL